MKKYDFQDNEGMFKGAPATLFVNAKKLRENKTAAEAKLWEELKGKKFFGHKFRQQHPMNIYILDFYCHQLKLGIEVDGGYHLEPEQKARDEERTGIIESFQVKIIRFNNEEVLTDISGVLKRLKEFIDTL